MKAMMMVGSALCFLAVCALEGNGVSLMQASMMLTAGMPMAIVGAFRSGICE